MPIVATHFVDVACLEAEPRLWSNLTPVADGVAKQFARHALNAPAHRAG
jgi:hypothetical protein